MPATKLQYQDVLLPVRHEPYMGPAGDRRAYGVHRAVVAQQIGQKAILREREWARASEDAVWVDAQARYKGDLAKVWAAVDRHRAAKARQEQRERKAAAKREATAAAEERRERALAHQAEMARRKAERDAAYRANCERYERHDALPACLADGVWLGDWSRSTLHLVALLISTAREATRGDDGSRVLEIGGRLQGLMNCPEQEWKRVLQRAVRKARAQMATWRIRVAGDGAAVEIPVLARIEAAGDKIHWTPSPEIDDLIRRRGIAGGGVPYVLFRIGLLATASSTTSARLMLSAYGRRRYKFRHWTIANEDIRDLLGLAPTATSSDVKRALKSAIESFPRTDQYRLQWSPRGERAIEDWEFAWVPLGADARYTAYAWMNRYQAPPATRQHEIVRPGRGGQTARQMGFESIEPSFDDGYRYFLQIMPLAKEDRAQLRQLWRRQYLRLSRLLSRSRDPTATFLNWAGPDLSTRFNVVEWMGWLHRLAYSEDFVGGRGWKGTYTHHASKTTRAHADIFALPPRKRRYASEKSMAEIVLQHVEAEREARKTVLIAGLCKAGVNAPLESYREVEFRAAEDSVSWDEFFRKKDFDPQQRALRIAVELERQREHGWYEKVGRGDEQIENERALWHAGVDTTRQLADAPGAQSEAELDALHEQWQREKLSGAS